jgi:ribonuclease-3
MSNFTKPQIAQIETTINYTFKSKPLLEQAFTRRSYANEVRQQNGGDFQGNEILEFWGDACLELVLTNILMRQHATQKAWGWFCDCNEGTLSKLRSDLSNSTILSTAIKNSGLHEHLIMNIGDKGQHIEMQQSVQEDLFEAIIGAVYIDSDFSLGACEKVVKAFLGKELESSRDLTSSDKYPFIDELAFNKSQYLLHDDTVTVLEAKNTLQEFCLKYISNTYHNGVKLPHYEIAARGGAEHTPVFTVQCIIGDKPFGEGTATTKKNAEKIAASNTIKTLKSWAKAATQTNPFRLED